jgi:hypothetical protein
MTQKTSPVAAIVFLLAATVPTSGAASPPRAARVQAAAPNAAAASAAGPWTMTYTTRAGVKMTSTLTLAVDGGKLTGTVSSPRGSVPLDEVSINGDDIAFAIVRVGFGDRIRIEYSGRIKGDTMTLKMKAGAREPIDITARRAAPAAS